MKKSYSIFLSILFCFLFCSLSAQDAQLNAASRKVIIEAPAEPGTHLEVAYRPAGSFFPNTDASFRKEGAVFPSSPQNRESPCENTRQSRS